MASGPVCRLAVNNFNLNLNFNFVSATNIRTHVKLIQVVTTQSTVNPDGTYVVRATIDIDGLSFWPSKTGQLLDVIQNFELLHFGYAAQ
jgi:hypothetical protein